MKIIFLRMSTRFLKYTPCYRTSTTSSSCINTRLFPLESFSRGTSACSVIRTRVKNVPDKILTQAGGCDGKQGKVRIRGIIADIIAHVNGEPKKG